MAMPKAPTGLHTRGKRLWKQIHELTEFDPAQTALLEEACRSADRLDALDKIIEGKGVLDLMQFRLRSEMDTEDGKSLTVEVKFDNVLGEARQQQNVFKQLLTALRLPDAQTGKRPQHRGARGAYRTAGKGAKVSSLDAARAKAEKRSREA